MCLCSDGVGRSGTFCALMVSLNKFRTEQMVDIFRTIQIMRGQRPGIVGNVVRPLYYTTSHFYRKRVAILLDQFVTIYINVLYYVLL